MAIRIKRPVEFYFNLILIFVLVLFSVLLLSWRPETANVVNSEKSLKTGESSKDVSSLGMIKRR